MEAQLLRLMLEYNFWNKNRNFFVPELFPDNLQKIFTLVVNSHEKYKKDLSIADIKVLFYYTYPATTTAQWELLQKFLNDVPGELSEDVAKEVIQKAWILEQARQITSIGADIINGKTADFSKIGEIIEKINKGEFSNGDELFSVSNEIEDILAEVNKGTKWQFYLEPLRKVASGIGPGLFTVIAARVETGKSASIVSLAAAPGGFAEQGAKIHFYLNEEAPSRTQARAVSCWTGMTVQEILLDIPKTRAKFNEIKDRLCFFDCRGKTINEIESHIIKYTPDIVIFDMLDKLSIGGTYAREDERLGAIYCKSRNIGIESGCAVIGTSQLNAEAEGKTYISTANLSNARTSKAAEADLLIGIGKTPVHDDMTRIFNIAKNKIQGIHTDVICLLRQEISRYVS